MRRDVENPLADWNRFSTTLAGPRQNPLQHRAIAPRMRRTPEGYIGPFLRPTRLEKLSTPRTLSHIAVSFEITASSLSYACPCCAGRKKFEEKISAAILSASGSPDPEMRRRVVTHPHHHLSGEASCIFSAASASLGCSTAIRISSNFSTVKKSLISEILSSCLVAIFSSCRRASFASSEADSVSILLSRYFTIASNSP